LNRDPLDGVALSVGELPASNEAEQVDPHSIPAGMLDTVPEPLPFFATVSVTTAIKVAVTVCSLIPVSTWQLPVPVQPPPDQPRKREPGAGVAVSVSEVPASSDVEQDDPQSIPAGVLDTDPEPVPATETSTLTMGAEPPRKTMASPPPLESSLYVPPALQLPAEGHEGCPMKTSWFVVVAFAGRTASEAGDHVPAVSVNNNPSWLFEASVYWPTTPQLPAKAHERPS
jgi:hypothetical protein